MEVLFAGDFSLQGRLIKCTDLQLLELLLRDIKKITDQCDFSIVNYESPTTNSKTKTLKDGPHLKNPPEAITVLKKIGFNIFTLANNHLCDYGELGAIDTIKECKNNSINIVGAGSNLEEARKPLIISDIRKKIGILNICENEFSIAGRNTAGAAPLDIIDLSKRIPELKKEVDYVVVIIHGGCEYYNLPTPRMKVTYHFLADLGADLIVNHHQHCFCGFELYNNVPIYYGLGNFFFDNHKKRNSIWNYGFLLKVSFEDKIKCELIPIEQCNEDPDIKILEAGVFNEQLNKLNSIMVNDTMLQNAFDEYIKKNKHPLSPFLPYGNHYLKALYHRGFFPSFVSKKKKKQILNSIRCETHFEILLRYLQ